MDSVIELVGVDRITMPPTIIEKLSTTTKQIDVKLSVDKAKVCDLQKVNLDEKVFRWDMNGNYYLTILIILILTIRK